MATITLLVLALALVLPVAAQSFKPDFKAGWDAYYKRYYVTALKHFRPLAKQGHAKTQHNLGVMYHNGMGVEQVLVMAYVWLNIAITNGVSSPKVLMEYRDDIQAKLTASERKLARKLSKLCLKKPASCPANSDD